MTRNNQYYNNPKFMLVKIQFHEHDDRRYTYVAHVRHRIEPGDWVTVPVGEKENVFGDKSGYVDVKTVKVTGVTTDMRYLPKDFDVKMVISNLKKSGESYQAFYNDKMKYLKRGK